LSSGQLALALNVAVFALVVLYFIHSLVFLFLPRLNSVLANEIEISLPLRVQQVAAIVSVVSMGVLIVIQLRQDVIALQTLSLTERIDQGALTSIELLLVWGLVGLGLYQLARMQRADPAETEVHGD
jgi:low temperature requirement protein LtrA